MIHKVCQLHVYGDDLSGWRWDVRRSDGTELWSSETVHTAQEGAVVAGTLYARGVLLSNLHARVHAVPAGWGGA